MSVLLRYQQLIRKVCSKDADEATAKQLNPMRVSCFFWGGWWGGGGTSNHHPSMHHPGMKILWGRMPIELSGGCISTIQQLVMHQMFLFTFFLFEPKLILLFFWFYWVFSCILRTKKIQTSWPCALHGATWRWPMATLRPGMISWRYLAIICCIRLQWFSCISLHKVISN